MLLNDSESHKPSSPTGNLHPNQSSFSLDACGVYLQSKCRAPSVAFTTVEPVGSSVPTHTAAIYISPTINTRSQGLCSQQLAFDPLNTAKTATIQLMCTHNTRHRS